MKLKGWKKLEKTLNQIFFPITKGETHIVLSADDSYTVSRNEICFGILRDTETDNIFMDYIKRVYGEITILPIYMYALLHEVGHSRTSELIVKEDKTIRKEINANGTDEDYFSLPAEKAATDWAMSYIEKHEDKVIALAYRVHNALLKFKKKNKD